MKYSKNLIQLQIILLLIYGSQCLFVKNAQLSLNHDFEMNNNYITEDGDSQNSEKAEKPVRLTVFYETLCPDCMKFFTEQLPTLFDNSTQLYRYVKFDFVPYGKAQQRYNSRSHKYTFKCQHGPAECKFNKLHACIVNTVSVAREFSDIERLVPFLICLMKTREEDKVLNECANQYEIPVDSIKHCLNSKTGDKLLAKYGNRTHNFEPKIAFIPTIVVNGKYNESDFKTALTDLKKVVCKYLNPKPKVCNLTQ